MLQVFTSSLKSDINFQVEGLTMHHNYETLKIEKIHKTEKFEHDRQDMKENHEYVSRICKLPI